MSSIQVASVCENTNEMHHHQREQQKHNNPHFNNEEEPIHQGDYCERTLQMAEDFYYKQNNRAAAKELLMNIITNTNYLQPDESSEIRAKEQAIYKLGEILLIHRDGLAIMNLLTSIRSFFALLPKAKTTKMVRKLFEWVVMCHVPLEVQKNLCEDTIHWAKIEKRTFLRHRIQLRLVEVLFDMHDTRSALKHLNALLKEVRRLDDRTLLLDIHLLESKVYYAIRNISKARAALVAARTTANSIYCPPLAQAEIDLQSGVLHAEEHDHKTAFSYLYEAFEGFHQLGDQAKLARRALHYMILAKIATDNKDELNSLLSSKNVLAYSGPDMMALRGIAEAYNKQDTHLFNEVLEKEKARSNLQLTPLQQEEPEETTYGKSKTHNSTSNVSSEQIAEEDESFTGQTKHKVKTAHKNRSIGDELHKMEAEHDEESEKPTKHEKVDILTNKDDDEKIESILNDEIIRRQLEDMYDTLMERHLLKMIEPYNRVQIAFLASLLKLNENVVEARISQLILDGKLAGIVDQQHRCLVLFDEVESARTRKINANSANSDNNNNNNNGGNIASYTSANNLTSVNPAKITEEEKKLNYELEVEMVNAKTTLHEDALAALECYDNLVTALFDKISGKFDALVEENLAKHEGKPKDSKDNKDSKDKKENEGKKGEVKKEEGHNDNSQNKNGVMKGNDVSNNSNTEKKK